MKELLKKFADAKTRGDAVEAVKEIAAREIWSDREQISGRARALLAELQKKAAEPFTPPEESKEAWPHKGITKEAYEAWLQEGTWKVKARRRAY